MHPVSGKSVRSLILVIGSAVPPFEAIGSGAISLFGTSLTFYRGHAAHEKLLADVRAVDDPKTKPDEALDRALSALAPQL